ncbi:Rieske (2Fe-2S) protein [Microlunatus ginsengisoli]|uniref:Nitrite reductase small subunit NirD n=1 Tax=Microlunatus ginsengisoli TaxID=363863 RepID=A0ABP6ZHZ4_9ACTN
MSVDAVTAVRLGDAGQVPPGEGRAFEVAGEQVAVFHLRSGGFRAVSAVCPHKGGPIADGQIDNAVVLCPLHLNAFSLDTGCSTTFDVPLRTYRVSVDADNQLVVSTPPNVP